MREPAFRAGRVLLAAWLTASVLAASGCGSRVRSVYEKVLGSPTYARTTENYTRTKEIHDGLDTRFILSATWLSPDWVRSFSEEYANIYYLDTARKEQVISRWKDESAAYERFFVALFTPDDKTNDLDKQGTLWSLRLVRADEKDYEPVYVRRSGLRPEEIAHFFPYSGTWYRAYEVAFPKEAGQTAAAKLGGPRFKLVLAGVQGRAVLSWEN